MSEVAEPSSFYNINADSVPPQENKVLCSFYNLGNLGEGWFTYEFHPIQPELDILCYAKKSRSFPDRTAEPGLEIL